MTRIFEHVLAQDDPFDFIYECISGAHGVEAQSTMNNLYEDIAVDYFLHPDDDFERIINYMIEYMEVA